MNTRYFYITKITAERGGKGLFVLSNPAAEGSSFVNGFIVEGDWEIVLFFTILYLVLWYLPLHKVY